MKDERVPRALSWMLVSVLVGLSGCNGCRGCEGQTVETPSPNPEATTSTANNLAPNGVSRTEPAAPDALGAPSGAVSGGQNLPQPTPRSAFCCASVAQNVAVAPDKHKALWQKALDVCNDPSTKEKEAEARAKIREILTPVGWPGSCN